MSATLAEAIADLLLERPDFRGILHFLVEFEERNKDKENFETLGYEYSDVNVAPWKLHMLSQWGILKVVYNSRAHTGYQLTDREAVKRALERFNSEWKTITEEEPAELPSDLFTVIVGYTQVKQLFWDAIRSERPCHILLVGPPGSAKSMFLLELDRLPKRHFALGGQTSKVGIVEELFNYAPKYLIIDELDDMPVNEQGALKSLMESGVVTRRKHGIRRRQKFDTWVFGGANNLSKLSDAIKSRFLKIHFKPYTVQEFKEVVVSVLTRREKVDNQLAEYIAERLGKYTRDPREAINLSRIASTKEKVDSYIELLWGHSSY